MTRRSGRTSKTRDVSPDQTLTPSRRSNRTSTRRKKDDSETETEPEIPKSSRKPENKMKDIEEKPEEESSKNATSGEKANGEVKNPSSHRRSRHSSKSEDSVDGDKKLSRSSRRYKHEEKDKIEEKADEEEDEQEEAEHNDEKNHIETVEENEKHNQDESGAETELMKQNEPGEDEDRDESDKQEEEIQKDEEEVEREKDEKEEVEERGERSSSEEGEAPAPDEKTEEDDNAVPEDAADKDSEEEEDAVEEEEETGGVQEDEADREEGEIEGSPPPVWSGEQRTWGVSKPNCKIKFLRSRDPGISTSVLQDLNTHVKPLARDILDSSARIIGTHETPAADGTDPEEEPANHEPMDTSPGEKEEEEKEEEEEKDREVEDENENPNVKKRRSGEREKEEDKDKSRSTTVRKVSIKKDKHQRGDKKDISPIRRAHKPPPSPTNVLFIYNLTRPFTLGQLRELLSRTGKIAPDGFWIDAIKSKCYVEYETEDQAEETRHALHEVRWPVTNDKVLQVEFTSKDAMLAAQIKAETQEMPAQRKTEPLTMDRNPQRVVMREWDLGKIADDEEKYRERFVDKERERDRKRKDRHHSVSPSREEPEARRRKRDIEAPAKLLDDLFRKTKTIPCLYWLPLTAEQIAVKEEMRKKHLAELEKRMKKSSGSRSSRDRNRRGRRS